MTNSELALRIALASLIAEFERLCAQTNKNPDRNEAYREAVKLMEYKDELPYLSKKANDFPIERKKK